MSAPEKFCTPVLVITFNRPHHLSTVLNAIKVAAIDNLYIASDGPRRDSPDDVLKVNETRRQIKNIDWVNNLRTLFHSDNLGCKLGVYAAIDWFFSEVNEGIIIEDDCLPNQDFFKFCHQMLERYREDPKVWVITGTNFQSQKIGDGSYYLSKYNHVWGWATWRRSWRMIDKRISFWPSFKNSPEWKAIFYHPGEMLYWEDVFDRMYRNPIDTWDYQWTASVWLHHGLTVTPNVNLVSNIGFDCDATHTKDSSHPLAFRKSHKMSVIKEPSFAGPYKDADLTTFRKVFGGRSYLYPLYFVRKFFSFLRN